MEVLNGTGQDDKRSKGTCRRSSHDLVYCNIPCWPAYGIFFIIVYKPGHSPLMNVLF